MSDALATKRPCTLSAVSERVKTGQQKFDPALLEFLDSFYLDASSRIAAISNQPEAINPLADAYLAAVAEHLASAFHLPCPAWTEAHGRDLTKPFFAGGLESIKASLTRESPAAFRRRMIFVSKNALDRPRFAEHQLEETSQSGRLA